MTENPKDTNRIAKQHLTELETPCLILAQDKLLDNLARMRERARRLGVRLRPHGKTAKSSRVAGLALEGLPKSITVSTLAEADHYFENGISDIIYAVGIAPVKLDHVAALMAAGADIKILLDSMTQADMAAAKGRTAGITFKALIELDSDGERCGLAPDDPALIDIGNRLHNRPGAGLEGVLTHAGGSYHCKTTDEIRRMARRERDTALAGAQALRAAGLPCPIVSIGSTPTTCLVDDLTGITEMRPGVYMFNDLVMAGLGVCGVDRIALSVLASVIGHQPSKGWVITDAGWMALSGDRGTAGHTVDQGYGLVCDDRGNPLEDLIISTATQEHGIITRRSGKPLETRDMQAFPIGSMVRILPNHACATAGMHARYHLVDKAGRILGQWPRINGW